MLCILKTFTNCFRLERMGFECRRRRQRPIISSTRSKHSWTVDTQLHDINDNNYVAKSIHCCMVTVWYNFAILIVVSVSDHRRQKRHFIFCIFPFRLEPVGESVTDIRLSNDEIVPRQKGVRRWKTQFFPFAHTMKLSSWVKNVATQITSLLPTSDDSIRLFFSRFISYIYFARRKLRKCFRIVKNEMSNHLHTFFFSEPASYRSAPKHLKEATHQFDHLLYNFVALIFQIHICRVAKHESNLYLLVLEIKVFQLFLINRNYADD